MASYMSSSATKRELDLIGQIKFHPSAVRAIDEDIANCGDPGAPACSDDDELSGDEGGSTGAQPDDYDSGSLFSDSDYSDWTDRSNRSLDSVSIATP